MMFEVKVFISFPTKYTRMNKLLLKPKTPKNTYSDNSLFAPAEGK